MYTGITCKEAVILAANAAIAKGDIQAHLRFLRIAAKL